jgi:transcriptional regulator with XRE-family HTH domain
MVRTETITGLSAVELDGCQTMRSLTLHEVVAVARGRRRELGLSQDDLAQRLGVSRNLIRNFERETGQTSINTVLRLLDVLDLSIDFVRDRPARDDDATVIDLDELLEQHRR